MGGHSGEARGAATLRRAIRLLSAIMERGPETRLSEIAGSLGLPESTAYRMASVLLQNGLISRVGYGRYSVGVRLAALAGRSDPRAILTEVARPVVDDLARRLGATIHFGVLDGGMVTYLVKACGGGEPVLTSEQIQFEAYCSGIGKVLLAHLSKEERDDYVNSGPFVALTKHTLTDVFDLRRAFSEINAQGYATDNAELQEGLYCLAVPILDQDLPAPAALSISSHGDRPLNLSLLPALRKAASVISRGIGGRRTRPKAMGRHPTP